MEVKELDMHCDNCPDNLMELCNMYTPCENETKLPICCFEEFGNLNCNNKKDICKIAKYCEENLEEWDMGRCSNAK